MRSTLFRLIASICGMKGAAGGNAVDEQQQDRPLRERRAGREQIPPTGVAAGRDADATEQRQRARRSVAPRARISSPVTTLIDLGDFGDRLTKPRRSDPNGVLKGRRLRLRIRLRPPVSGSMRLRAAASRHERITAVLSMLIFMWKTCLKSREQGSQAVRMPDDTRVNDVKHLRSIARGGGGRRSLLAESNERPDTDLDRDAAPPDRSRVAWRARHHVIRRPGLNISIGRRCRRPPCSAPR